MDLPRARHELGEHANDDGELRESPILDVGEGTQARAEVLRPPVLVVDETLWVTVARKEHCARRGRCQGWASAFSNALEGKRFEQRRQVRRVRDAR